MHYLTDSEKASFGSPVFNDQWLLVALDHRGIPKHDNQGRILSVDGVIWERYIWVRTEYITSQMKEFA